MTIRVAITGFGRIGRNVLRAVYENKRTQDIQVVAINDTAKPETNLHLLRHDTTHGRFPFDVEHKDNSFFIAGDEIKLFSDRNPANLPWKDLDVDVVFECTGAFTSKETAMAHIDSGAKKVLISAPGKNVDATVVYGVNQHILKAEHQVVSNASCTTNCLAPLVKPLHDAIGIERGLMTTIHAYTNDQRLTGSSHKDLRRARAAAQNMIPTKTGAAVAISLVMPELAGKLDGFAVRVPVINVSLVDLTFEAKRDTSVEEINQLMREAAAGELKGVLAYSDEPLVSSDFNHTDVSSTFDASFTKIVEGNMVKVMAWYDNEWGFSNRMIDTAVAMMQAK